MKRVTEPSIQRHLLKSLMLPLFILWIFTAAISSIRAFEFATQTYDHELANSADSVAARLKYSHVNKLSVELPDSAVRLILHSANEKFFYTVFDDSGKALLGDKEMKFLSGGSSEPIFDDGSIGSEPVRINRIKVDSADFPHGVFYIQVAETLHHRRDYALQLLFNMVMPDILLIALVLVAIYFGIERGLAPINQLAEFVTARSQWDFSTVPEEEIPREIRPFVRAINGLLSRVASDLESQQRFVANAAHQFRTPVAGLKTYVGYAKRLATEGEISKVLDQIDDGTDRLTHLTNRLLNLAKFEPTSKMLEHMVDVDLNTVVVSGTTEVLPLALQKNIDLSFEPAENGALVRGNVQALQELVMNLVENAVLYTQISGQVAVRTESDAESCCLTVEDNGPGIPESERERIFERFYRVLGTEVTGSGLGLAIVKEIVDSHKGSIVVSGGKDGIGTRFVVKFPLASGKP